MPENLGNVLLQFANFGVRVLNKFNLLSLSEKW